MTRCCVKWVIVSHYAVFCGDVQIPDRSLRWSLQWCLTVPLSLNNDSLIGQSAVVIQSTKIVFMASIVVVVIKVVRAIPHPLIPSLSHSIFYFSLSYLLHLFSCFSIPFHSTRIVPLRFRAGCHRRRLNLAIVFCVRFCVICIFS